MNSIPNDNNVDKINIRFIRLKINAHIGIKANYKKLTTNEC